MAKKRPSIAPNDLKTDAAYWRRRLFRNSFTHHGKRFQVRHWSVKIQHRGTRKTLSLRAGDRAQAAQEAYELYHRIISRGWDTLGEQANLEPKAVHRDGPERNGTPFDADYWEERLIYRKYTEELHAHATRELSVRIQHEGTSHYFPLETENRKVAGRRATKIYNTIVNKGWRSATERFPRELSLAIRWLDNPVAWTYTTIHTRPNSQRNFVPIRRGLNVAIAESDEGVRSALRWCIEDQQGFHCLATFATASAAIREVPRLPVHLILVSQELSHKTEDGCLNQLRRLCPKLPCVLFSIHEDADELFKAAPGGASGYLFRRTSPRRLLEPIAAAEPSSNLTPDDITRYVRTYFEATIASVSADSRALELTKLTHREHEILGLLSKGQADKEIADLLGISTWTVHGHLKKIFEKLGAHNRTEAVLKYLHK